MQAYNPRVTRNDTGLGMFRFARHYSRIEVSFLSWKGSLEMFTSLRSHVPNYALYWTYLGFAHDGFPHFGNLPDQRRCVRLPEAYRACHVPSSPAFCQGSPSAPLSSLTIEYPSRASRIEQPLQPREQSTFDNSPRPYLGNLNLQLFWMRITETNILQRHSTLIDSTCRGNTRKQVAAQAL